LISLNVASDISRELARQIYTHPNDHIGLPHWRPSERYAILAAEVGEVAEEITIALAPVKRPEIRDRQREALRTELLQVAACAIAWIQALDEEVPS
jgi:NTP pyrophosphatase (non-canonical NTP hydrolase)